MEGQEGGGDYSPSGVEDPPGTKRQFRKKQRRGTGGRQGGKAW